MSVGGIKRKLNDVLEDAERRVLRKVVELEKIAREAVEAMIFMSRPLVRMAAPQVAAPAAQVAVVPQAPPQAANPQVAVPQAPPQVAVPQAPPQVANPQAAADSLVIIYSKGGDSEVDVPGRFKVKTTGGGVHKIQFHG